jgi:exosortase E/protease (VPEID-CTERM system)
VTWFKHADAETAATPTVPLKEDLPSSILICFILFLIGALISGFDQEPLNWLYPVKVLLGALPVIILWKTLKISMPSRIWEATGFGVLVCIVWVVLIPVDEEFNAAQVAALSGTAWAAQWAWVAIRFAGSILVAPVVEELFFRSYLLSRMSSQPMDHSKPMQFNLLGLAFSSLAFAFIHQDWIAGGLAGAIYGFARYRGNLGTAIWAHGVTNALLCVYAIGFNQWGYL